MPSSPSSRDNGPFDLSQTPIHLASEITSGQPALPLPGFGFDGPAFEEYGVIPMDKDFDVFEALISPRTKADAH